MFHTMQLTKAYVAETPCNQLLLIDCMLKINLLVINNVAVRVQSDCVITNHVY